VPIKVNVSRRAEDSAARGPGYAAPDRMPYTLQLENPLLKSFVSLFQLLLICSLLPAAALAADVAAEGTRARDAGAEEVIQVWLGGVDTDDDWSGTNPADGEPVTGEFGTLPYLGGAGQQLWGGKIQAGFEGGGLVTWKNDSTKFYGRNGALLIDVDNSLFSFEVFMGGLISIRPVNWLRVYAAAGPSVAYAYLDGDDADEPPPATGTLASSSSIEFGGNGSSVSLTVYARGGIEFATPRGFTFGASARYANHEFDFDDDGKLELGNVQYFLTLGQRL